ncbi:LA_2168 family protein [Leptospira idonii]|uniref:Alginate export domain-containing protein n=1 Tax=Leptospira idonii TaxID=1193500 RepID=A0A4R9LVD5_9LEPT|nr:hypothetical protein [Leptospira idonii]TGN18203.1 hypothetical protein EHS15_12375 [Leptospira idonii]
MRKILLFLFFLSMIREISSEPVRFRPGTRIIETALFYDHLIGNRSEIPGWYLRDGFPESKEHSKDYLSRSTESLYFLNLSYDSTFDSLVVHWDMTLLHRASASENALYLGKNSYLGGQLGHWFLGVGKKEHVSKSSPFYGYTDGGEGVFIERDFHLLKIQVYLWDYYRGFSILEKEYLRPDLISGIKEVPNSSQRRRHSFGLSYGEKEVLHFGIHYSELGSTGKYSREIEREVREKGGDGDSVISGSLGGFFPWNGFYVTGEFLWAKGTDRTYSRSVVSSGSLPIQGEAISFGLGWSGNQMEVRWSNFLNDSDQRTEENRYKNMGYIGMGTHIGSTYFLSQIFQIHPYVWMGNNGWERSNTILRGRSPAYYGEISFQWNLSPFQIRFFQAYYLPYLATGKSDGKISFKKENFEPFFLAESSFDLSCHWEEKGEIGMLLSHVWSTETIAIRGTILSVYGRIQF